MFKKHIYVGALAIAMLAAMPSCGGGDSKGDSNAAQTEQTERVALEPMEVTVAGNPESEGTLAEYISIADGNYTVNFTDAQWGDGAYKAEVTVSVNAKAIPELTDDKYIQGDHYKLVFLDESGNPITAGELTNYDLNDIGNALRNGGTLTLKFTAGNFLKQSEAQALVEKAKSVRLSATGTVADKSSSSSDDSGIIGEDEGEGEGDNSGVSSSSATSGNDVDAFLDSYEQMVVRLEQMYKKFKAQDPTALIEYPSFVLEVNDASDKLDKMKSDFTPAQDKRYLNLLNRQAKAAM